MKEMTYTVKVDADGDKFWYVRGKLSREDGPAIEYADGDKWWYVAGKCHREDGPAVEDANGTKAWYVKGKLHREDGPAVEWADGTKAWYVKGKSLTEKEFNKRFQEKVQELEIFLRFLRILAKPLRYGKQRATTKGEI